MTALRKKNKSAFDEKISKEKFSVLNRKISGTSGNRTLSKSRALEVRDKSILPALKRRGRTGSIVDKRFGERTKDMSADDRMLARFSRERLKKHQKHNVETSDTILTHRGLTINDEEGLDSDPELSSGDEFIHEEDSDQLNKGRTKQEIMQDVINKSKTHKYERQRIKEENLTLCDDLDTQFKNISHALLVCKDQTFEKDTEDSKPIDDYTQSIFKMSLEKRAAPSDRTKTNAEIEAERELRTLAYKEDLKRNVDEQSEENGSDLDENVVGARSSVDREISLEKTRHNLREILDKFCGSRNAIDANEQFSKISEISKTNSVIQLAIVVRERLQQEVDKAKTTMPTIETLMIFHLCSLIFRVEDAHHVVITPVMLHMSHYLLNGRILDTQHLACAIFLMQTQLSIIKRSQKLSPELLNLLYPLLVSVLGLSSVIQPCQYKKSRLVSKIVHEQFFIGKPNFNLDTKPLSIEYFNNDCCSITKEVISGALVYLAKETCKIYAKSPASKEIIGPFQEILTYINQYEGLTLPDNIKVPMKLQKFKPVPLPMLTPDLEDGFSGTRASREERKAERLKSTFKRELKGAKRELRRDAAYISREKAKQQEIADMLYQTRQRQILGSIANEDSSSKRSRK